jgi:Protein of unknown function (DUF3551)
MRRSLIALGALITAASIFQVVAPVKAATLYPVCRYGGGGDGEYRMRCDFPSFEECKATAQGIGGSCIANPAYNAASGNASTQGRARHANVN